MQNAKNDAEDAKISLGKRESQSPIDEEFRPCSQVQKVEEPKAQSIPQQASQYKPRILATRVNNPIPTIHVAHQ